MFNHLRTRLTVLYAGLFVLALAIVSAATYGAIATNARHVIHDELKAGGAVFDRVWALRSEQLTQAATVVASDFGFRSAVATHDTPTTQSALENLRSRLGLDLAFFIDTDGKLISTGKTRLGDTAMDLAGALESSDGPVSGVFTIAGAAYQGVAVPVMAPTALGWVVFAKKIDRGEMAALERLSAIPLDALVLTRDANGGWTSPTTRMSLADQAAIGRFASDHMDAKDDGSPKLLTSRGEAIAMVRPLKSMRDSSPALLLLRYPLDRAMAPYRPLLGVIVMAGLASIVLLVIGNWMLAKSLTRPISALDEAVQRLRDGETASVTVSTSDEIGRLSHSFNAMAADIRQREDELKSTRAFLDAVVENLPAMVVVKDRDHRFALINRAGEALLGLDRQEVLGKTDHDLFPDEQADGFLARDRTVMESGQLEVIEDEPITTLANGLRYLRTKKIAIPDPEGGARYLLAISEDITERKLAAEALERALHQAEAASRAKSSFLANMSHEVRTPLNGVLGVSGILADTTLDAKQREMVEIIETSAGQLQRVLADVLDLARVEAGQLDIAPGVFDLGATLRDIGAVAQTQADTRGLAFKLELDPALDGLVAGDRARFEQILSNLLGNALKFTEAGEIALIARRADALCQIEVRDTGIGFDPAIANSLFEPFTQEDGSNTRRFGGLGVGLGLARNLARAMGGDLTADGRPGVGAAFYFNAPFPPSTIEIRTPPAMEAPVDVDREPDAHAALQVLVVDDHATNRKVVELILNSVGVEMTSAEDGAQAVEVFKSRAFDVVLMDIQMPVMDGLTAIRLIRAYETEQALRPTPMLVLSANTMPEHVKGAADAGADGHLSKPITAPVLLASLEAALDAAEAADEPEQAAAV